MGQVRVGAKAENLMDLFAVQQGTLTADRVRYHDVPDALVDTGAMLLGLPQSIIQALGLRPFATRPIRTAAGQGTAEVYPPVRLTVEGRVCHVEVMGLPDGCPILIGQIPLEALDFIVDMPNRRLIGNPEHGGQFMMDAF